MGYLPSQYSVKNCLLAFKYDNHLISTFFISIVRVFYWLYVCVWICDVYVCVVYVHEYVQICLQVKSDLTGYLVISYSNQTNT